MVACGAEADCSGYAAIRMTKARLASPVTLHMSSRCAQQDTQLAYASQYQASQLSQQAQVLVSL